MAYIRAHGRQLELVHGKRHPESRKVEQRVIFTFHSKHEALDALGDGTPGADNAFQRHCETAFPEIRFDWSTILEALRTRLHHLPDRLEADQPRAMARFGDALHSFTRQLVLADPRLDSDAKSILRHHERMLEVLAELLRMRIEDDLAEAPGSPSPLWSGQLDRLQVPPDVEEFAVAYRERGDLDKAEAAFTLLINSFENYAEGHNYLGLIALDRNQPDAAIAHFRRTVEIGRRLFPARLARSRFWGDLKTRPYMRGLRNLTLCLNRKGAFDEALSLCDRLDHECGDSVTADYFRALIFMNTGHPLEALELARKLNALYPDANYIAAFALLELGHPEDAVEPFIHAAINLPRTAQMHFSRKRLSTPQGHESIDDHNTGIALAENLHRYLIQQPQKAKTYFVSLLATPSLQKQLAELQRTQKNWFASGAHGDRRDFDTLSRLKSQSFAAALTPTIQAELRADQN